MNVAELRTALEALPDDMLVVGQVGGPRWAIDRIDLLAGYLYYGPADSLREPIEQDVLLLVAD